jgi:hypothetical protein
MKPGPNYKMSRAAKTQLARLWNRPFKNFIKRTIIQGELYGRVVIKGKRDNSLYRPFS